ncbi:hypothetical protein EK21DRAFT_87765 [Setomelanomma holmii]|uniref:Uncharacterized protein n=1 Tax=Setomelanomma holmii TaxID=210430 RepID=A0A9P4HCH3_9PLEO|nr:hypothetical protein EK21DRAFT_87765 [Setomelanomma holmii]
MPPFGLYRVPQHHLYGDSPPAIRPVYNTMDFQDDETTVDSAKTITDNRAQVVNGIAKTERKKDKKKRTSSCESGAKDASAPNNTPQTAGTTVVPTLANSNDKTGKDKSHKKSKDKNKDATSTSGCESMKKRNRDSGNQTEQPSLASTIREPQQSGQPDDIAFKKRKREKDNRGIIGQGAAGPVEIGHNTEGKDLAVKKSKKDKKRISLATSNINKVPTGASPYASTPRKTPIPLPQKLDLRATSGMGSPKSRDSRTEGKASEVLVNETPPSQMAFKNSASRQTGILFNLSLEGGAITGSKKPKKAPTQLISFPSMVGTGRVSAVTPPAFSQPVTDVGQQNRPALTSSNLLRYTQPLNDEPKPRPRGRAASVSSASSMSIKDAFARMSKPSPSSSFDFDLFFTPESRKKIQQGSHAEADVQTFDATFSGSRASVNFKAEETLLLQYLRLRAGSDLAGPPPCLKQATGCSSKSEQILRLMREDDSSILKITICSDAEQAAFDHSVAAALEAERFLRNAIMAYVPVPLGKLEGVYSLYCPKYGSAHIDKYGYGQRTLSIQRPSGFNVASQTYTARVSIPPRPMAYTVLAFTAPTHASFRSTTITTSVEGYTMGLVCLGNGYLVLRMDLSLLLTGMKSEVVGKDGDTCMEFLGVRERDVDGVGPVKWDAMETKARKESEAKQMADKKAAAVDAVNSEASPKKKRGRPTNAERERRALEAAAQT